MITKHDLVTHAQQKQQAYNGLARIYSHADDTWIAVHAQIAGDLAGADALLYSHGMNVETVQNFHRDVSFVLSGALFKSYFPMNVIEESRRAIARCLPAEVNRASWEEGLQILHFMDLNPVAEHTQMEAVRERRLGDKSPEEYVVERRMEQASKIDEANHAWTDKNAWAAAEAAYSADLAGFEAWLVQRSIALGDTDLVQCELLWGLGCAALEQLESLPSDPLAAIYIIRSRLAWAAGPSEVVGLAGALDTPAFG